MEAPLQLTHTFRLTPAGCDAARRLPPSALVADIIDLAVDHADRLGVGYSDLEPKGVMWVLGRLSIETDPWPAMFDEFGLTTWVESINRLGTERDFELTIDGRHAGYARTVWSILDLSTRRVASLAPVTKAIEDAINTELTCPIERATRLGAPADPDRVWSHTFALSDLDFNRHVTTTRYVDLMMDNVPLELYDNSRIARLDLAFHREARYGDRVDILSRTDTDAATGTTVVTAALTLPGQPSAPLCAARILLCPGSEASEV